MRNWRTPLMGASCYGMNLTARAMLTPTAIIKPVNPKGFGGGIVSSPVAMPTKNPTMSIPTIAMNFAIFLLLYPTQAQPAPPVSASAARSHSARWQTATCSAPASPERQNQSRSIPAYPLPHCQSDGGFCRGSSRRTAPAPARSRRRTIRRLFPWRAAPPACPRRNWGRGCRLSPLLVSSLVRVGSIVRKPA